MTQTATKSGARGQAVAGGITGALVIAVLAVVFVWIRSGDDKPAAAQPSGAPSVAASEPAPTGPATPTTPPALSKEPEVKAGGTTKLTKLVVTELVKGTGPEVKPAQNITVNYKLVQYADGKPIESSWQAGQPLTTQIGVGGLIKGWDQGIPGQKVGSRIQLDIPEALAYPGRGDLRFVVDILAAE